MGYDRLEVGDGDAGAVDCGGGRCVDCKDGGAGGADAKAVWLSTPRASEMDGSDCLVVCLAPSFSCSLVLRDSGGV